MNLLKHSTPQLCSRRVIRKCIRFPSAQEITGIDDHAKVVQLLSSRHWELEAAVHDAFNEKEGVPSVFAPDPHPPPPPPLGPQPGVRRRQMASSAPGRVQESATDAPPSATPHGNGGRSRNGAVVAQRQNWWEWLINVTIFPLRFVLNTASDLLQFVSKSLCILYTSSPSPPPEMYNYSTFNTVESCLFFLQLTSCLGFSRQLGTLWLM
jgi:hypothetical protein